MRRELRKKEMNEGREEERKKERGQKRNPVSGKEKRKYPELLCLLNFMLIKCYFPRDNHIFAN